MLAWVVAAVPHLKCHAGIFQLGERQLSLLRFRGLNHLRCEDAFLGIDTDPTIAAGRANGLSVEVSLEARWGLPLEVGSLLADAGVGEEILQG